MSSKKQLFIYPKFVVVVDSWSMFRVSSCCKDLIMSSAPKREGKIFSETIYYVILDRPVAVPTDLLKWLQFSVL